MRKKITEVLDLDPDSVRKHLREGMETYGAKRVGDRLKLNGIDISVSTTGNSSGSTLVEVLLEASDALPANQSSATVARQELAAAERSSAGGTASAGKIFWTLLGIGSLVGGLVISFIVWKSFGWVAGLIVAFLMLANSVNCFSYASAAEAKVEGLRSKLQEAEKADLDKAATYRNSLQVEMDDLSTEVASILRRLSFTTGKT